jgi:hypothetical protein
MYNWSGAEKYPEYFLEYPFLKANLLTHIDHKVLKTCVIPPPTSDRFSSSDSPGLLKKNLKIQPADWHYRTKDVRYKCNSNGYRADEWDTIDWAAAVVIFGCSCTVGVGLAEDETISYQLSTLLNRPVVNMGVSASSMQYSFINSMLLSKNFPIPYAVVQLWTNIDRFTVFKEQDIDHIGPWDSDHFADNIVNNPYQSMLTAAYTNISSREFWKNKCRYYSASFFEATAHYTESDWVSIDNQARDLIHPGKGSAKQMADLIAANIT